jgi:hypothetical protein
MDVLDIGEVRDDSADHWNSHEAMHGKTSTGCLSVILDKSPREYTGRDTPEEAKHGLFVGIPAKL